ncbi:MAG: hypothetical protein JNK53_08410 [Phycisphaerae bacterium]|nr:hypothetical protein [Phycisphaerae bacterium]
MASPASRVMLHTRTPESLADPEVRRNVVAAAHALGERMGVAVLEATAEPSALHLAIEGPTLVATGFAAELRRTTERWHTARYGAALWRAGD